MSSEIDAINLKKFESIDQSVGIEALHVESLNPIVEVLKWTKENNYEWLSTPEVYDSIGWTGMCKIGRESASLQASYLKERRLNDSNKVNLLSVETKLEFNSFVITEKLPELNDISDKSMHSNNWLKVYMVHKPILIGSGLENRYDSNLILNLSDEELIAMKVRDITEGFNSIASNCGGWIQASLYSKNPVLRTAMFGEKIDSTVQISSGGFNSILNIHPPSNKYDMSCIYLDTDMIAQFYASTFFKGETNNVDKITVFPVRQIK
jgi:hypothetical protein